MKNVILALLAALLLICPLSSCSFPDSNYFDTANEKSSIESFEETAKHDSGVTVENLATAILQDEIQMVDQICYSDNQEYAYILASGNDLSRLFSLEVASGELQEVLTTDKTVRMAIHSDAAFLLQDQRVIKCNLFTKDENVVYELPENIPLAKSYILPESLELAYYDDGDVFIFPLSEPEKMQRINLPDEYYITLIRPLDQDLLCNAACIDSSERVTLIVDKNGSIKYQCALGTNDPVLWERGALLTQGIEGQNSTLYLLSAAEKDMWKLSVPNSAEANTATISNNGQWIMTAVAQEDSREIVIRLYNLKDKTVSNHKISDVQFSGTINFVRGGNSLIISDNGNTAIMYFIDENGFQILKVNFPNERENSNTFDLVGIED